jgi:hypothetical protein
MMALHTYWQPFVARLRRRPGAVKSFEHALRSAGGLANRVDGGLRVVPIDRIVGSVGRWQVLRADFCFRVGPPLTERHARVGALMQAGRALPPLELYELRIIGDGAPAGDEAGEYYVVDGHHRVAMARRLGQDFFDAHVVVYRVRLPEPECVGA